jgi:hypothetical protein
LGGLGGGQRELADVKFKRKSTHLISSTLSTDMSLLFIFDSFIIVIKSMSFGIKLA